MARSRSSSSSSSSSHSNSHSNSHARGLKPVAPSLAMSRSSIALIIDDQQTNDAITPRNLSNQKTDLKHLNKKLKTYVEFSSNLQTEIDRELEISKRLKANYQKPQVFDVNKLNSEQYRTLDELRRKIKTSNNQSEEKNGQIGHSKHEVEKQHLKTDRNNAEIGQLDSTYRQLKNGQVEVDNTIRSQKKTVVGLRSKVKEEDEDFKKQRAELLKILNDRKGPRKDLQEPKQASSSDDLRQGLINIRREIDEITRKANKQEKLDKLKNKIESSKKQEFNTNSAVKLAQKHAQKALQDVLVEKGKCEISKNEINAIFDKNALTRKLNEDQLPGLKENLWEHQSDVHGLDDNIHDKNAELQERINESKRLDAEIEEMKRILKLGGEKEKLIRNTSIRKSQKMSDERKKKFQEQQKLRDEERDAREAREKEELKIQLQKEPVLAKTQPKNLSRSSSRSSKSSGSSHSSGSSDFKSYVDREELAGEGNWNRLQGGTILPHPNFNPQQDADHVRRSLSGMYVDGYSLTKLLTNRTQEQIVEIEKCYKKNFKFDMANDIYHKTSAGHKRCLVNLLYDASERDAKQLNGALQINDVQHFTEILATRPSRHIRHIRRDFVKYFKHDILEEVQKSFDLPVYAFMKAVFEKERPIGGDQIKTNEDGQCYKDAIFLAKFRAADMGPVALKQIIDIFANRSFASLFVMMTEVWSKVCPNKGFIEHLSANLQGHFKISIVTFSKFIIYLPPQQFADILQKSIKGSHVDDNKIVHILTSRAEIDLKDIIAVYDSNNSSGLERDLRNLPGKINSYRQTLLAICGFSFEKF